MFLLLSWLLLEKGSCQDLGAAEYFTKNVLANYSNDIPPWDTTGKQVELIVSTPFAVLANLEQNTQVVILITKVNARWIDPRLRYDASKAGSAVITVPTSKVWIPTFEIYNSMEVKQPDRPQSSFDAQVTPDGEVSILWNARFNIFCQMWMDNFPFDNQQCSISFSCGLSPVELLSVHATTAKDDFLIGNPEWDMLGNTAVDFWYLNGNKNMSMTRIEYSLRRNPHFYVYFLIIPTFIITVTCLIALLFPFKMQIGDKLNLCLAGLLGLTFMLSVIVEELPRTSHIPLMGKWLLIQMVFCLIGLLSDIPKNYIRRKYPKHPRKAKIFAVGMMFLVLLAECLSTILLFTIIPPQPPPESYKTL